MSKLKEQWTIIRNLHRTEKEKLVHEIIDRLQDSEGKTELMDNDKYVGTTEFKHIIDLTPRSIWQDHKDKYKLGK